MKIGVLALQGDFREHIWSIQSLGEEAFPIKLPQQLDGIDGLIIPGGESTVMGKLMVEFALVDPLKQAIQRGLPTWGTCAGMVLLARSTDNALAGQSLLATMDIHVCRNAFGAQRESFTTTLNIPAIGVDPFRAVFIRAPIVLSVGPTVEILARIEDPQQSIVAVRQDHCLATAFHPEIAGDTRFHRYFLDMTQARLSTSKT
jgi:pyridoxal 5'-phosphate synthase pdxT subunit